MPPALYWRASGLSNCSMASKKSCVSVPGAGRGSGRRVEVSIWRSAFAGIHKRDMHGDVPRHRRAVPVGCGGLNGDVHGVRVDAESLKGLAPKQEEARGEAATFCCIADRRGKA